MIFFLILVLIIINGFFVMAEISVVSSRKSKLEVASQKGNKLAKEVVKLIENPSRFLSTVQVGITVIGILTGIFSGDTLAEPLQNYLMHFPSFAHFAREIAVTIVLIPITFLAIMIGELIPKRIGLTNPEAVAMFFVKPINFLSKIASPFIMVLEWTSGFVLKTLNIKQATDAEIIEEEIKSLVEQGMAKGTIEEIEQDIVENVFLVGDRNIGSMMTHTSEINWIETDFTKENLQDLLQNTLHSVYPVKDSRTGEVVGTIRVKEVLLNFFYNTDDFSISKFIKEPLYISESMSVYKVLEKFRTLKARFGLIVDEYGAFIGIVTMHDILDAIVGDLDVIEGSSEITQREDGSWLIDAQISFADFCSYFEINMQFVENKGFNTLGGLVLEIVQHLPVTGEKLTWRDFSIEIVDMDGMRMDKLLLYRIVD
jgi:putative hemolysin